MRSDMQETKTLDYSTADPRSRPWLKALFVVAFVLAVPPLGLALFALFYAFGIGAEGSADAAQFGSILLAVSLVWIIAMRVLYLKVFPGLPKTGGESKPPLAE